MLEKGLEHHQGHAMTEGLDNGYTCVFVHRGRAGGQEPGWGYFVHIYESRTGCVTEPRKSRQRAQQGVEFANENSVKLIT